MLWHLASNAASTQSSYQPVLNVEGILGRLLFLLHPDLEVKRSITQHQHQAPQRIGGFCSKLQARYDFQLVLHPERVTP